MQFTVEIMLMNGWKLPGKVNSWELMIGRIVNH